MFYDGCKRKRSGRKTKKNEPKGPLARHTWHPYCCCCCFVVFLFPFFLFFSVFACRFNRRRRRRRRVVGITVERQGEHMCDALLCLATRLESSVKGKAEERKKERKKESSIPSLGASV